MTQHERKFGKHTFKVTAIDFAGNKATYEKPFGSSSNLYSALLTARKVTNRILLIY